MMQPELERLVEHLLAQGVHGLSPLGSTGEFAALTPAQRLGIVKAVVRSAAGRVPVVPGVAAAGTADAIEQGLAYLEAGADGVVLVLHPYFALDSDEVLSFYAEVADALGCPIVIYLNPPLLGFDLSVETLDRVSHIPNIRYLKDASANTGRLLSLMNRVEGRLEVFSASAHVPLLVFLMGGAGWMAGPACAAPAECVELWRRFQVGDLDGAWALQRRLWPLNELFQRYSMAACIKAALRLRGFEAGDPIPPQAPLGSPQVAELSRVLAGLDPGPA